MEFIMPPIKLIDTGLLHWMSFSLITDYLPAINSPAQLKTDVILKLKSEPLCWGNLT